MRILVTNDDGIEARGLRFLAEAMKEFGEIVVVAPDREKSATAHSLTLHRPLRIYERAHNRYAVDGTPTDCVNLAIKEILKDDLPKLVVSGINHGANLGDDITYSGTVSAALEGALLGIPSIAISLTSRNDEIPNFRPAEYFVQKLASKVLSTGFPKDVLLNVNVPNIAGDRIDDYAFTTMGKRNYEDAIVEKIDPRHKKYYWIGGDELGFENIPGSDCNAISENKVSITPVRLDLTHEGFLKEIKQWTF